MPEVCCEVEQILRLRSLSAVFQPVVDLQQRRVFGYEGLIRGPSNSPLHGPLALFGAAGQCGHFEALERLCREVVIEAFARQQLEGRLFLNVSPDVLLQDDEPALLPLMAAAGLDPRRVIIELTEHRPLYDYAALQAAIAHYRALGFSIAIDDLGEGFFSLRLWSELRPEFVKIDRHFVQNLHQDPLKAQFLRSIQQIAANAGCRVIAEGIEIPAELQLVRELGISLGQGYVFARPGPTPPSSLPAAVLSLLQPAVPGDGKIRQADAERLLQAVPPVEPATPCHLVYRLFCDQPQLQAIAVVDDGLPVGLIPRRAFIETFARPFNHELFDKKPCRLLMDQRPLVVDKNLPLQMLSGMVVTTNRASLGDGFIITERGRYLGLGSGHDLMRELTEIQITAARYANPITLLPGNVPINEQMEALLAAGQPFHACYCDLDHFKPLNDVYGYRVGDEVIRLTGRLLEGLADPQQDFVGHVGGDDFILLLPGVDALQLCRRAIEQFGLLLRPLLLPEHVAAGGFVAEDRRGQQLFHPLVRLSIGVVRVMPGQFLSHHDISRAMSEAKAQAKAGDGLFIDRRQAQASVEYV